MFKGIAKGLVLLFVLAVMFSSYASGAERKPRDGSRFVSVKPWTVMVYMAADNNLGGGTPGFPDFMDFDEIEKALVTSGADVNVVVLWDLPGSNDTAIYWVQPDGVEGALATYTLNGNKWYIPSGWAFTYPGGYPQGVGSPSEENMGAQATLTHFLNWVWYNFDSTYYALILWDHGGGWEPKARAAPMSRKFVLENGAVWEPTFWPSDDTVKQKRVPEADDRGARKGPLSRGVCWDDTDSDYLTTKEVANGISGSNMEGVANLGFDACLMQMLEVAYEMLPVAWYMTASEETEWGQGWAYHQIISGITAATTPLGLAQLWGVTRSKRFFSGGLDTISSLNLGGVSQLATDVSSLANRLNALLGTNDRYQEIMYAKLLSLCFAYNEYLDLYNFCAWINLFVSDTTAKNRAQTVMTQIANTVVAMNNGPGYGSAGGISIYMPHYHDLWWGALHSNYTAANFAFCNDHTWDGFVNAWLGTDYPDPYEANNTPATAYDRGTYSPGYLHLCRESDFDDSSLDWYKLTVTQAFYLDVFAWCTEEWSDTVIYLYDSLANAQANNYFASDDDGLAWWFGRNQYGSYYSHPSPLPPGTYYLKVIPHAWIGYGTERDYEVWISTSSSATAAKFRVTSSGDVLTDGSFFSGLGGSINLGSADVAEWVRVSEPVEAGDVLEFDPELPGRYRKARGPCSILVGGVVSTNPGVILGSSSPALDIGPWTLDSALLALLGIVPVKVTDENGPIQVGDLLVASSTSGYAMRWDPENEDGCGLVGKALEGLESGTGRILVLLMR